jgi:Zn-dependent M28 family amino/carboxypeptidase
MIRMPGTSYQGALPAPDEPLKTLGDELRREVQYLAVSIGERNVRNRPQQLAQAADYIEAQFKAAGIEVKPQEYEVSGVKCHNLEAEIPGKTRPGEIDVVGAHYDTVVGTAGANDNATGVAATLVLARRFAKGKHDRTLRLVAFVNEEPPYFQTDQMGSRVYARKGKEQTDKIVAMLSLETLGWYDNTPGSQNYPAPFDLLYPSTGNFIGFVGNTESGDLVRRAIGTFRQYEQFPSEGGALPEAITGVGFSDQWSFWQEGYPAIMVTDTALFRYPHYHDAGDTIDKVDFDRMARVVRGLENVVVGLVDGG